LLDRKTRLAYDRAERAFGNLAMIGNYQSPMRRVVVAQNHVAAVLPIKFIAHLLERTDNLAA
jgi:hypothetical protein